ncbi:uncharacterized protein LOC143930367 isoform X1 [Lithobates pipiens]
MSVNVVTTVDGKASCKTAEGSVININISQRTFWDSLNDRLDNTRKIRSEAPPTSFVKATALPVVLGVSQFPLGVICLAVSLFTTTSYGKSLYVFSNGVTLWMGIPLLLGGLSEVVAYIKNHGFWVFLSFICQLLIFCVSVSGLAFTENERLYGFSYDIEKKPCESLLNSVESSRYQSGGLPKNSYGQYNQDTSNWNLNECQETVNLFMNLSYGVLVMLLVIGSWGAISSTITVIYRLKRLCGSCCSDKELAKEDTEPLEKTPIDAITV